MNDLVWRFADGTDRQRLETFTCTHPAPASAFKRKKPVPHPRPWELIVQKWFHEKAPSLALPGRTDDSRVCIAVAADEKLAAAAAHMLPAPEYDSWLREALGGYDGPIRLLAAMGVALGWRGTGGGVADELCDRALSDAVERSRSESTLVVCRIDLRNRASERMAARNGFTPLTEGPDELDPDMRQWYVVADP